MPQVIQRIKRLGL